jgi:hypothetical protein
MQEQHMLEIGWEFQMLIANICQSAIQPVVRQANNEEVGAAAGQNKTPYARRPSPNHPHFIFL